MPLDPDLLFGLPFPERTIHYADRDVMLYALSVGATAQDLGFVYEKSLGVIPSYAQMLAFDDSWIDPGGIDMAVVVHGGLDIRFESTFAPEGSVLSRPRIVGLGDKGPGRGGIVHQETELWQGDIRVASVFSSLFARGTGGFGGDRGEQGASVPAVPETAPDRIVRVPTAPNQAALFRLLGDRNPLHIDPAVAQVAGFAGPILHGASTFGTVCFATIREWCGGDVAGLSRFAARFSGPVYPGEVLELAFWRVEGGIVFRARAEERGTPVLDGGFAGLR